MQDWTKRGLLVAIMQEGTKGTHYNIRILLPKALKGKVKEKVIYQAGVSDKKSPWLRKDCGIPIKWVEGAVVDECLGDSMIVGFIISILNLSRFVDELWESTQNIHHRITLVGKR